MRIAILALIASVAMERASARTVSCEPATFDPAVKAQVDDLAKNLFAPRLLDAPRTSYCRSDDRDLAFFQTIPVRAEDGAYETGFALCDRNPRWKCELSRERAVDVIEAEGREVVRLTTRDDFSAGKLRELYSVSRSLAVSDSTPAIADCRTHAEAARSLLSLFFQGSKKTIRVAMDGELYSLWRDYIELKFSMKQDANGVISAQYGCITRYLH